MRRFLLAAACVAAPVLCPVRAGVGELSLDRGAVTELLAAALPASVELGWPAGSPVAVELGRPGRLDFVDGAVETTVRVSVPELGIRADLRLRYVPRIDPLYGGVSLVAEEARVAGLGTDLAPLLPAAALPRRAEWTLDLGDGRAVDILCHVQGVHVGDERLELELGFVTRSAQTASSNSGR